MDESANKIGREPVTKETQRDVTIFIDEKFVFLLDLAAIPNGTKAKYKEFSQKTKTV